MAADLIVLIATSGRSDLLQRTLESLCAVHKPVSYKETIVVENGAPGGAKEIALRFKDSLGMRFLHVDRANKSHALNVAVEALPDCLIYFTDDDARFPSDLLRTYHEVATAMGPGHFFGGPIEAEYEAAPPEWLKEFMPASARGWSLPGGQQAIERGMFLGFNWAAFTIDLRKAGPFDVNFGPGSPTGSVGQDTNMQNRLLKLGVPGIYLPTANVWHYVPRARCSPPWILRRAFRHGIRHGILEYDPRCPKILGYPRWTVRALMQRGFNVVRKTVRGDEVSRFGSRHEFSFQCGYMKGARLARSLPEEQRGL